MRALVLIAALLAGIPPAASAQEVKSVFAGADPDIEFAEDRYWIYPTGGDESLSAWSSPDKIKWTRGEPLVRLKDITWAHDDRARHFLWAPDMVQANGSWYFYYSVGPQNPTPSRIGVATCKGPAGPCTDARHRWQRLRGDRPRGVRRSEEQDAVSLCRRQRRRHLARLGAQARHGQHRS
jgi:hypothetical protein